MMEVRNDAPQGITSPELCEKDAFSMSGLLTYFPFFTTFLCLCLDLCLWLLLDTTVLAFQGAMVLGTVSSIDQNHTLVLLVLLLSQGQRVPLSEPQKEEAGAQLAASMVKEEPPCPNPYSILWGSRAMIEQ